MPLPAVITVKEGINLPRYPSLPGRLRAKKLEIATDRAGVARGRSAQERLVVPQEQGSHVELLGEGPAAAPRVVEVLKELGVRMILCLVEPGELSLEALAFAQRLGPVAARSRVDAGLEAYGVPVIVGLDE